MVHLPSRISATHALFALSMVLLVLYSIRAVPHVIAFAPCEIMLRVIVQLSVALLHLEPSPTYPWSPLKLLSNFAPSCISWFCSVLYSPVLSYLVLMFTNQICATMSCQVQSYHCPCFPAAPSIPCSRPFPAPVLCSHPFPAPVLCSRPFPAPVLCSRPFPAPVLAGSAVLMPTIVSCRGPYRAVRILTKQAQKEQSLL